MRVLFSILAFLSLSALSLGQTTEPCSADALHASEMSQSEPYARNFQAVREAVQRLQSESNRDMELYTIPVVVHVMHRGSPLGENENISDAQILSAIEGMNDHFRKIEGSLGDGEGVDTFIQFELARRTPEGEPTNGITRVNGNVVPGFEEHGISNGLDDEAGDQEAVKSLSTWYGDDYVNIFIVPEINGNDGEWGVQGFAYLGPTGDARDGLVVLYNAFGLEGNLKYGRELNTTVSHEMGHHLSLYHTFSNTTSCSSETDCATQGDEVCDTPPTQAHEDGCNTAPECDGALIENYMDYSWEGCKNMFTAGQRDRMRGSLESVRSSLLESLGGVPVTQRDLTIAGLANVGESTCIPALTPEVIVTNFGSHAVQGFELTTSINGLSTFSTIHQESVAAGASVQVMLPELALNADTNELNMTVTLLNNVQDDFAGNDHFTHRIVQEQSDFWTMTLNADNWANEISWRIEDDEGNAVMEGGDYPIGAQSYIESGCVPVGCYNLVMEDTNGDGLCSIDFGDDGICDIGGSVSLTNAAGEVLLELDNTNNDYGALGTWEVCALEATEMEGCADENNNGVCDASETSGCQDVNACNFTPGAIWDDGSCTFAEQHYNCAGECLMDSDGDGTCDPFETEGCTDNSACNYVASATDNDGSCEYTSCAGCTDPNGCNYDASATISSSCDYPASHYNCDGTCVHDTDGDGVCDELEVEGCDDNTACNFAPSATDNDESCEYAETHYDCDGVCLNDNDGDGVCDELEIAGCQDVQSCNYNADATDAGACEYPETFYTCDGTCENDTDFDGVCDELEVAGCQDPTALNFDEDATEEDGSCIWVGSNCEVSPSLLVAFQNHMTVLPSQTTTIMVGADTSFNLAVWLPDVVSEPGTGSLYNASEFELSGVSALPLGVTTSLESQLIPAGETSCLTFEGIPEQSGVFDVLIEGTLTVNLFGQPFSFEGVAVSHQIAVLANPDPILGCTYAFASNYLSYANVDDGSCIIAGCTDPEACNHQVLAALDDESCDYSCMGCTYEAALNFDSDVTRDDGSCVFDWAESTCPEDLDNDGLVGSADLLLVLGQFGLSCENP